MTETEKGRQEQVSRKKKRKWPLLLLGVAVLLLLLLLLRSCGPAEEEFALERELAAEMGLLPGMSEEEIRDRLNRKVADSMMNVSINPTPVFPSGTEPGNLRIENIPGNSCSFTVTLIRSDTGDTILTTGVIDPGFYVENIPLDTPLPPGQYPCVAMFTGYDTETLKELGEAGTTLLLTVEK